MFSVRLTLGSKCQEWVYPTFFNPLNIKIPVCRKIVLLQFSWNLCCRKWAAQAHWLNTGCWRRVPDARPHPGGLTVYLSVKGFIGKEMSFSNLSEIKKRGRVVQCSNIKSKDNERWGAVNRLSIILSKRSMDVLAEIMHKPCHAAELVCANLYKQSCWFQ